METGNRLQRPLFAAWNFVSFPVWSPASVSIPLHAYCLEPLSELTSSFLCERCNAGVRPLQGITKGSYSLCFLPPSQQVFKNFTIIDLHGNWLHLVGTPLVRRLHLCVTQSATAHLSFPCFQMLVKTFLCSLSSCSYPTALSLSHPLFSLSPSHAGNPSTSTSFSLETTGVVVVSLN